MIRKLFVSIAALFAFSAGAQVQQSAPFVPQGGGTRSIAVTASAQNLTLATPTLPGPLMQLVIQTTDVTSGSCTSNAYFRWDGSVATTSTDMPAQPKIAFLVSVPSTVTTLSVIGDATGCKFYATVGAGQ